MPCSHHARRLFVLALLLLALPPQAVVGQSAPPDAPHEVRGVVVLRVSEELLDRMLAKDIDEHTTADRCVLGIRAVGPSHTLGNSDVEPKPDRDDAVFRVTVTGQSNATTKGRSGPAIIKSHSSTRWTVNKDIYLEGSKFITRPGRIESSTTLRPGGIHSTLPGLRGAIVRRVASNKERESRRRAEQIINQQTSGKVLTKTNEAIDEKIAQLNSRIRSQAALKNLLPLLDTETVACSTNHQCIHLAFLGVDAAGGHVCPLDDLDPSETELWIHTSMFPAPLVGLPGVGGFEVAGLAVPDLKVPGLGDLSNPAEQWLGGQMKKMGLAALPVPAADLSGLDALGPTTMQMVDDWIVLRSEVAVEELVE